MNRDCLLCLCRVFGQLTATENSFLLYLCGSNVFARQQRKKVLVKLFQKLVRSSRVGLSPSADGETPLSAFLFCLAFLFAPFVPKRKAGKKFYVAVRLLSLKTVGTGVLDGPMLRCRLYRTTQLHLAFPSREGGPLAVDE